MALAALGGLFVAAFLAATLLPMQSEAVLVGVLTTTALPIALVVFVATVGNVLGSVVNFGLGRGIERFRDRRWFPVGPEALERAQRWFAHVGVYALLLSFLPVVGDPLTVVAGAMRVPFPRFLALVTISKGGRYLVVAAAALAWFR